MGAFVRLAFHDAGTYDRFTGFSGANASIFHEMDHPHSTGLHWALNQIVDIKNHGNHITNVLSMADLIQLGGYAAIEYLEGPIMNFRMGRVDATASDKADPGILPGPDSTLEEVEASFDRMGFNKQEIIAIMG